MKKTTIQINIDTLDKLKMFKRHERESYDFILNNLLDEATEDSLTDEEINDIKEALEEVKRGETVPFDKIIEELGIKLQ